VTVTAVGSRRRRGLITIFNGQLNQRIQNTERFIVGDVFLGLGGLNIRQTEDVGCVGHDGS
jgi:hypothetical protein